MEEKFTITECSVVNPITRRWANAIQPIRNLFLRARRSAENRRIRKEIEARRGRGLIDLNNEPLQLAKLWQDSILK